MATRLNIITIIYLISHINHEYDDQWSYTNRLSTCDPHAKRLVTGFDPPQEVDDQEEVIFTYDVEFRVTL
ncbi:putative nonaspanin (TM9SF) [Helianthus annuus]|nr:putative nonaspanin (TM9SF) [Helianthus annuus]